MESTYLLAKAILKPALRAWFKWHIEGLEHIPRRGAAILACNHIAFLDPFATAYAVDKARRVPRYLAKSELFEDKRIAWILKGAKQIPVRRGTREAPMALDAAEAALEKGEIVVIFPEGTITADPDLAPMEAKTGIGRLALLSGAPVLPCAVWGTQNVWPKGYAKRWWPPGQEILMRIAGPRRYTGDARSPEEWRRVGVDVMSEIGSLVASLRPAIPDRRRRRAA